MRRLYLVLLALMLLGGCTRALTPQPSAEHLATSTRFVHNINGGHMAYEGFRRAIERMDSEQPGMAELVARAFADTSPSEFEALVGSVYARHLSHEHLRELESYTQRPALRRFFNVLYMNVKSGEPYADKEMMRLFSADELTEIIKFSRSPSVTAMNQAQPQIRADLEKAGEKWAETRFMEYLDRQQ